MPDSKTQQAPVVRRWFAQEDLPRRSVSDEERLARLAQLCASLAHLSFDVQLQQELYRAVRVFEVEFAAIWLAVDSSVQLQVIAGLDDIPADQTTFKLEDPRSPEGSEDGFRIVIDKRVANASALLQGRGIRSAVSVPMLLEGRQVGVLQLYTTKERSLSDDRATLLELELVADRCALIVGNTRIPDLHPSSALSMYQHSRDALTILHYIEDGVILTNENGKVQFWNRGAEQITGVNAREIVGNSIEQILPGWSQMVGHVPAGPAAEYQDTHWATVPFDIDGKELWISIARVVFHSGVVYAFRDVTVDHEFNRRQSDFAATVSHELRTPVASVYGAAMTLGRPGMSNDMNDQLIEIIQAESERLSRLIDDILLASQLDSTRFEVNYEPYDPMELIQSVRTSALAASTSKPQIKLAGQDSPIMLIGDSARVRQVLTNLVDNAVKYSPAGAKIEIGFKVNEPRVRYWVKDAGIGIPKPERGRIFEKYNRLDPQHSRNVSGTGLGLYICRELVNRMRGRIWTEPNSSGIGSVFYVELPLHDRSANGADTWRTC